MLFDNDIYGIFYYNFQRINIVDKFLFIVRFNFFVYPYNYLIRKLIILDHPCPKGSKDNQFAPFRVGVNELIVSIIFSLLGKPTDIHIIFKSMVKI